MYTIEHFDIAGPGVAERVVELQRTAYALEAALIGFAGIPPLHESVQDVVAFNFVWLGAFENERLMGALAYRHDNGWRDIDRLFVDPTASRRGIGRALVAKVLDADQIRVSTGTANTPAVSLYESLGFHEAGVRQIAAGVTVTIFERHGAAT